MIYNTRDVSTRDVTRARLGSGAVFTRFESSSSDFSGDRLETNIATKMLLLACHNLVATRVMFNNLLYRFTGVKGQWTIYMDPPHQKSNTPSSSPPGPCSEFLGPGKSVGRGPQCYARVTTAGKTRPCYAHAPRCSFLKVSIFY